MEMNINKNELVELCKEFIDVPSPVSYYEEVFPYGGEGKGVCKVRRDELGTEGSGTGAPKT